MTERMTQRMTQRQRITQRTRNVRSSPFSSSSSFSSSLSKTRKTRGIGGKTAFENIRDVAANAAVVIRDAAEKVIDSYVTVPPFYYKSVRYVKVYNKVDKELNKQIDLSHKEMPKMTDIWSFKMNSLYKGLQKKNPYRYKVTKANLIHVDEMIKFLFEKKLNILIFHPESFNIFINANDYLEDAKTPNEQLARKIVLLKLMKLKKIVFVVTRVIYGIFEKKLQTMNISRRNR